MSRGINRINNTVAFLINVECKSKFVKRSGCIFPKNIIDVKSKQVKKILNCFSLDVTTKIMCREKESEELNMYVSEIMKNPKNKFIYVSGNTGSGKTLVVKNVMDQFKSVLSELGGPSKSRDTIKALEKCLALQKKTKRILFVFDEIDRVSNYVEMILNPLFELLFNSNLVFSIIAISNISNFMSNTISRFSYSNGIDLIIMSEHIHSIVFQAYRVEDLREIINERVKAFPGIFTTRAIEYCAKTIAVSGGDVRKAFSLLKYNFVKTIRISLNDMIETKYPRIVPIVDIGDISKSSTNFS
ncbi:hypothetical protein MXB_703, partial [Myxobolus squamalis]